MDTEMTFKERSVDSTRVLYTPSAFAKTNLLHLQETGGLTARMPHTNQRRNLASYLFFIVLSGSGALTYDNQQFALTPGDCVFINCQKPYAHMTGEQLWTLKWAHFTGPTMHGIYQKYLERGGKPTFHVDAEHGQQYAMLLESLYATATASDYMRDMLINEQLSKLLTFLMEASWSPVKIRGKTAERHTLQDVKNYIDENFAKKIALDELADRFFINKFYLTRVFKEQYGYSIVNYIMMLRVSEAKNHLRFSDLSMDKIGECCGMPDQNYFSRVFRKVEGVSPSEFKRQWRETSKEPMGLSRIMCKRQTCVER